MVLQVLVVVLVVVLGSRQQACDMADALGDALPEEQLGSQAEVLRMLEKAEADHRLLARTQLLLVVRRGTSCQGRVGHKTA